MSSCSNDKVITITHTEHIISVPEKIQRPNKPTFELLSTDKTLDDVDQFKQLQIIITQLKTYSNALVDTIIYYESTIDAFNLEKEEILKKQSEETPEEKVVFSK